MTSLADVIYLIINLEQRPGEDLIEVAPVHHHLEQKLFSSEAILVSHDTITDREAMHIHCNGFLDKGIDSVCSFCIAREWSIDLCRHAGRFYYYRAIILVGTWQG
jgi:hypothetical protein